MVTVKVFKFKSFYLQFYYFVGVLDTYFIDEHPQLFQFQRSQNRAQKLLNYIGNVLVNGPSTPLATSLKPSDTSHPHVPITPLGIFFNYSMITLLFFCTK